VADWVVDNYIKKLAIHRSVTVSLRQRVTGKVKKLIKDRLGERLGA
jgi:hypothetical protein